MAFDTFSLRQLLRDHGQNVVLNVKSAGTYDNTTGSVSGVSITDVTVRGYFYDYTSQEVKYDTDYNSMRRAALSHIDSVGTPTPEPKVNDTLTGDGKVYQITKVDKIMASGGTAVFLVVMKL